MFKKFAYAGLFVTACSFCLYEASANDMVHLQIDFPESLAMNAPYCSLSYTKPDGTHHKTTLRQGSPHVLVPKGTKISFERCGKYVVTYSQQITAANNPEQASLSVINTGNGTPPKLAKEPQEITDNTLITLLPPGDKK